MQILKIATGRSRKEKTWKNQEITWNQLIKKLRTTVTTRETMAEYKSMSKDKQSEVKDIGGFVGGEVKDGRRLNGNVVSRSMLTLDLDYANADFWGDFTMLNDQAACVYSTHKHTEKSPRLRLIIPLKRNVSPEEYEAIARRIAFENDIEQFDDTTYQPARLMYWPSTSKDGMYLFESQEGDFLDPDKVLKQYRDWKDCSTWPESSRVHVQHKKLADKQGDPLQKDGLVGAFCKAYSIHEAIATFLSDVYGERRNGALHLCKWLDCRWTGDL